MTERKTYDRPASATVRAVLGAKEPPKGVMRTLVAVILFAPATVLAGGFAVPEQTAVSGGTGGASVARADDPGAAWFAPSALADGGGLRLDASLILARPSLEARALDGSWTASNDSAWSTPPHLNVSFAAGDWAGGVSVGVPFGSGVAWGDDWEGQYEIRSTDLVAFRIAPFVAYSFGKVRVSAGLHVDLARMQIGRDLDFIDTEGTVAIDMDGRGLGGDASIYWQASPRVAFAAAYRSRTKIKLAGGADFTAPDAFADKTPDGAVTSEVTLPDQIVAGTFVRVVPGYAVLADVELTAWSTRERTVIDFAHEGTPDIMRMDNWHNSVAVRAGGEYTRGPLTLRHGMFFDQSPAPQQNLAPSSPDASRLGLTVGASYGFGGGWAADAFVESMWLLRRDSMNDEALAASYGGRALLLGLGVRYQRAK